jgi:hypothetical protein
VVELAAVALITALLGFWWRESVEARTLAFEAAHAACERDALQLLDGSVALQSWRLARGASGRLSLVRTYAFDYSDDGAARHHGFVVLRGREVELVGLGPTLLDGQRA